MNALMISPSSSQLFKSDAISPSLLITTQLLKTQYQTIKQIASARIESSILICDDTNTHMILNCWSILLICGRWTPGKDFWERIKDYWCRCNMQTTNLFLVSDLDPMATCIPLQAQRCAAAATANRPATLGLGGRGWGLAYGFCPLRRSIYLSRRGWPCARQAGEFHSCGRRRRSGSMPAYTSYYDARQDRRVCRGIYGIPCRSATRLG